MAVMRALLKGRAATAQLALAAALGACQGSGPPPATEEPARPLGTGVVSSAPQLASFPGGAALVVDPKACELSMLGEQPGRRWTRSIGRCNGVLDAVVAPNSFAYARTATELVALAPDGAERWRTAVGATPIARVLARPAATLDSLVVVAVSPRALAAFKPDGKTAWRFEVEGGESLVTAPEGSGTEGVLLVTSAAAYSVGSDGTLRWRAVLPREPH